MIQQHIHSHNRNMHIKTLYPICLLENVAILLLMKNIAGPCWSAVFAGAGPAWMTLFLFRCKEVWM